MSDWLRETVITIMVNKNLSSYKVAHLVTESGGTITEGCIRSYLRGKKSMTSEKLSLVLRAIGVRGLKVTEKKSRK